MNLQYITIQLQLQLHYITTRGLSRTNMKLRILQIRIPLRSQSTSASYQSPLTTASSLDLEFVLSLLDSSKGKGVSLSSQKQFQNKLDERIHLGQWSQMKYRAIESERENGKEREKKTLINSIGK